MGTLDTDAGSGSDAEDESAADVNDEAISLTLYLRASPSSVAARRQQSVLDTLGQLAEDDALPALSVERWSRRVNVPVPEDGSEDAAAVELYEELEAVADRVDARLDPFFEEREAAGGLLSSGPPAQQVIVFPVVCVAVRRAGEVTGLYPCWKDGVHHSVEDCLGALAAADSVENL
jgi:hypothetical protein